MILKINSNEFLKYLKENSISNMNFIKSIRFNKKSITVKMYDIKEYNLIFNSLFNENYLYSEIISYLKLYIKENENISDAFSNKDYLESKYEKLLIR